MISTLHTLYHPRFSTCVAAMGIGFMIDWTRLPIVPNFCLPNVSFWSKTIVHLTLFPAMHWAMAAAVLLSTCIGSVRMGNILQGIANLLFMLVGMAGGCALWLYLKGLGPFLSDGLTMFLFMLAGMAAGITVLYYAQRLSQRLYDHYVRGSFTSHVADAQ